MKAFYLLFALFDLSILNLSAQTDTIFKPSGKAVIQVFGYFKFDATKDAKQTASFGCGRAFFGYSYNFLKSLSATIILDANGRPTSVGTIIVTDSAGKKQTVTNSSTQGSYYSTYLKFANIQWKPSELFMLQIGGILENHYITQERFWGYRYVYETFQDRYYGSPSTDFGVIGYVKLNNIFAFDVAVTNGEGIRVLQDNYGKMKIAMGIDLKPLKGLITRFYYANTVSGDPSRNATQDLISFFMGYKLEKYFRTGFDFSFRHNDLNYSGHDFYGYSFYETYIINPQIELFARFDNVISNTLSGATQSWNIAKEGQAYIAGIHFQPVRTINISINYQGWKALSTGAKITNYFMLSTEFKI